MNFSVLRKAALAAVVLSLAACDTPSEPLAPTDLTGAVANQTYRESGKKVTCPGKSGGVCDMTSSVLSDGKSSWLTVRTGGYDEATGDHDPNGTFDKIQYKIYDAKGKLVKTVNADSRGDDDSDSDSDGARVGGTVYRTRMPAAYKPGYRVEIQANIRNHSGKKGTSVVRGVATPGFLPDIDLSAETIEFLVGTERRPLAPVVPGAINTYVVDIANLEGATGLPSTVGIRTLCVVTVDGRVQVPGIHSGFSYVGGAYQYVGPGATAQCAFTLKLSEGQHTIKVTAVAADMFADCDESNNSTTATVSTGVPADLRVVRLERIVNGVAVSPLGSVAAGMPHTFRATVESPTGSQSANAWCTVLVDGTAVPADRIQWTAANFTVPGGGSAVCEFSLTFPDAGNFDIRVIAASAGDPDPTNDSLTGALVVTPAIPPGVTTDLVVREVTPLAPVLAGVPVQYVAKVGVAGGTQTTAEFTCAVTSTPSASITLLPVTGPASTTTDGECRFTIAGMSADNTADASYQVAVSVTPVAANELTPANNVLTFTQVVRPGTVDLAVKSFKRLSGADLVGVDSVPAGPSFQYVATVGALAGTGATSQSASLACSLAATNAATGVTRNFTGTASGPVGPGQDATCTFSMGLEGNGDFDQLYNLVVNVQPVGTSENPATTANNTLSVTQLAIVRVDVGIELAGIQMFVNGVERAIKDTISLGLTGNFVAYFRNHSTRAAIVRCDVTTNPPNGTPIAIAPSADPLLTIPAGAVVACPFSYTFADAVVAEFQVKAHSIQPLDLDPSNNVGAFSITPVSNLAFPNLDLSNVTAIEAGIQNASGTPIIITKQLAGITRVVLAFTNKTSTIGDFVLSVNVRSNGAEFSRGVLTAPGLQPGGLGVPSCVVGVDAGTAATLNGLDVRMEICAEEAPGQPTVQAISVNYSTGSDFRIENPAGLFGFGPTLTFDLKLEWRLFGRTAPGWDQATGLLEFDVLNRLTDPEYGGYSKIQTGVVRILRNGP